MSPHKKLISFQVGFVLIACVIIELSLRLIGYAPGDLRPNWLWFQPVDSLYTIPDFITAPNGLLIANKDYWSKHNIAINSDGFKGAELQSLDTTHKRIMFIGDSFTWGLSAKPFDSSFCNILTNETPYQIINTGIPAADPVQYAKVAELYIPKVKPDIVFVMFYMGNDLMRQDRPFMPGEPFYYWTNAGAILADIDGMHFSNPQSAYNYLISQKYFLKNPEHWYQKVISHSALLSRLYAARFRIEEKLSAERAMKDSHITLKYLKQIKQIAQANNTQLRFVLIREEKDAEVNPNKYIELHSDLLLNDSIRNNWLFPEICKKDYTPLPDGHLNNAGHREYADFLKFLIKEQFKN